ncbi:MAG: branched-chain amino acid ABC transporter permease [Chloroflexota bacterium]
MISGKLKSKRTLLAVLLGIAVMAAVPWLVNPYYTSIAIFIGIHSIVTVGLCLLMGYTGQISLGQAAFYGFGAYVSAVLSKTFGVSPWLAMLIAAVLTGVFAYFIGVPILRLKGNYLAMATLGLGMMMHIAFREADGITGGPSGLPGIPYLSIGSFVFNTDRKYYYLVWAFCLAILLISQNIVKSRTGRALRAIRNSEIAAESLGVRVSDLKVRVFTLSAVYASLAGSLYVHYLTFVAPQPFDFLFSVRLIAMAVVGGLTSIWGAIFGTAVVTLIGDALHGFGELDTIFFGLALMLMVIFMPHGLWLHFSGIFRRRQQKQRAVKRSQI